MQNRREDQSAEPVQIALRALDPERFGFQRHLGGWMREFSALGQVAFASMAWPHNQLQSFDRVEDSLVDTNALALLVSLQQRVWGFPPEETVPVNILSILEDTGGGVVVAYEPEKGFNADGWLGFAIGMGTRSGVLYSHMLGVREDVRGSRGVGWCLKVLQAYLAVESGHHAMTWTFDPLRGANARLNLEKLRAVMSNLTIDKYGVMRSSLYGDVPTDRFTAYWDLLDPHVHQRLAEVLSGTYRPRSPDDVECIPEATKDTVRSLAKTRPEAIRYRIPGSIDQLLQNDPERAVRWRQEMRQILGEFMTVRRAGLRAETMQDGPVAVSMTVDPGDYLATDFVSWVDPEKDERQSFYILTKGSQP